MKYLAIIKTGETYSQTAADYGDFDDWIINGLNNRKLNITIIDIDNGESLPPVNECCGVVIAGSHYNVTEKIAWLSLLENWLQEIVDLQIPLLGICFGHQLLAQALNGTVGFHPRGKEIGTKKIFLLPECNDDPLFSGFPETIAVQTAHAQTILSLPRNAICLASNAFEANHVFKIGKCAWGVQFHPEFSPAIMRQYISRQSESLQKAGLNPEKLLKEVRGTPYSEKILFRFLLFIEQNLLSLARGI
jgi:GMP synthase (glutamine-hydrolysing)